MKKMIISAHCLKSSIIDKEMEKETPVENILPQDVNGEEVVTWIDY